MSTVKKTGNRAVEKPQGVFYNAQQLYKRWSGLVKLDAIYGLMSGGKLPCVYIQNVRCTHQKHVEHFEEELFGLDKMVEFNKESKHGAFTVTPAAMIDQGRKQKSPAVTSSKA